MRARRASAGGFVLALCLGSLAFCRLTLAQITVEQAPESVNVVQGGNVTLVCDLRNVGDTTVHWYYKRDPAQINGVYLSIRRTIYSNVAPDIANRLSLIGQENQEDFTLMIRNVQAADEGTYYCWYGRSLLDNSVSAVVTVLVPPDPTSPECTVTHTAGTHDYFEVGDLVRFTCSASGGNPAPSVAYYKGNVEIRTAVKDLDILHTLSAEDNGVALRCDMDTPALPVGRSCSVTPLQILPNATIRPAESRVEKGARVGLECTGEGLPRIASYEWTVTDAETGAVLGAERYVVSENGSYLTVSVLGDLALMCVVRVPSGLSGNATARVAAERPAKTTAPDASQSGARPSESPPGAAPAFPVVALAVGLPCAAALVVVLAAAICWWRRGKTPGPRRDESGDIAMSDGRRTGPGDHEAAGRDLQPTGLDTGVSAEPDGGAEIDLVENPLYERTGRYTARDVAGQESLGLLASLPNTDGTSPRAGTAADPTGLYANLDPRAGEHGDEESDGPADADELGLVYADLDLGPAAATAGGVGPITASEPTLYASVRP